MGNKNSKKRKLSKFNPYNHNSSTHSMHSSTKVKKELTEDEYISLQNVTKMSRDEIKNCYRLFMQDYPNGKLDKNEFKIFYIKLKREPNEKIEKICEFVFSAFDTDRSGYLDFNEFLAGFCLTSRGSLKEKLSYAFNLYDIGIINSFKQKYAQRLNEIFELLDKSENLSIDEIREVIKGMLKLLGVNEMDHDEIANNCILKLDKNKDGLISRDEFVDGLIQDEALRRLMSPFF